MNRLTQSLLASAALLASFLPSTVSALPLTIDFTAKISHDSGPGDFAGMDGATVKFTGTFADGTTWNDVGFGEFIQNFSSHSFTITGAANSQANGVYSDPDGLSLDCFFGVECLMLGTPALPNLDYPRITLGNGFDFDLGFSLLPGTAPNNGDFLDSSHFTTSFSGFSSIFDTNPNNVNGYVISSIISAPAITGGPTDPNVGGGSNPIPVPATIILMMTGLMGIRVARLIRKEV